ncbi:Crp/Fnr family transcriptional regulator [Hymenobacter negativus]|uniref:Crp/Fnr family transcriptional regulator n=1 Tax=Hymenobacter negativus TaxID=2795026 RepID=A0ABS3QG48_9BACT|nr:Crp/Fnr family transcriptional regulator [Hymenobacter negativus]MBO2010228.1 Crp/Fnr family transcriptional regulator [Hymenobacter negativus]
MYTALLAHIARYVALTPAETQLVCDHLTLQSVPRKAHLLEAGQPCTASYFVLQGCLRMYFITEKGTEQITRFALESWWLADYSSLLSQRPSQFFMQAVEPTTVAVLDHARQEELLALVPVLERYFRLVLQRLAAADQTRPLFQFGLSAEERYHQFSTLFPGFVQRVPQYMLASYLGFTPEFLSKIRARPGGHAAGKASHYEPGVS